MIISRYDRFFIVLWTAHNNLILRRPTTSTSFSIFVLEESFLTGYVPKEITMRREFRYFLATYNN